MPSKQSFNLKNVQRKKEEKQIDNKEETLIEDGKANSEKAAEGKQLEEVISSSENETDPERSPRSILDKIEEEKNRPRSFDFKYIPREKLVPNPENKDFSQDDIDQLAMSILENGLLYNLVAIYDIEEDTYTIEAGERRFRALNLLIEKYKDFTEYGSVEYNLYAANVKMYENGFPVNVKRKMTYSRLEEIDSVIRLYASNLDVRNDTPAKKLQQINRLNELMEERKRLNGELSSNTSEIAKKMEMTERQIQKYQSLNNLIPELKELFDANKVSISEGSSYAKLTEEEQLQIVNLYQNNSDKAEIEKLAKEILEANKLVIEKEKLLKKAEESKSKVEEKLEKLEAETEEKIKAAYEKAKEENKGDKDTLKLLEEKFLKEQNKTKAALDKLQAEYEAKSKEVDVYQKQLSELKSEPKAKAEETSAIINSSQKDLIKQDLLLQKEYNDCLSKVNSLMAAYKSYEKLYDADAAKELELNSLDAIKEKMEKLAGKIKF